MSDVISSQQLQIRRLSEADLVRLWDEGEARHPVDRALVVLAASVPQIEWGALASLPLGRRDGLLLLTREASFGPELRLSAECPACAETFGFTEHISTLLLADPTVPGETSVTIRVDDDDVVVRPLDSKDLAALLRMSPEASKSLPAGRLALARRATVAISRGGSLVELEDYPAPLVAMVSRAVESLDPMAALVFPMTCPACRATWSPILDVAALLWSEIVDAAKRALHDVRELAGLFGWAEDQILAMNPARRRFYLGLGQT